MDSSRRDERLAMVQGQLEKRGIRDPRVLEAMRDVPRHLFVPEESRAKAYEDGPLPIGGGQTVSQPYIVASMAELIEPRPSHRVLEVGVGSGYSTAVLCRLAGEVYGIERDAGLLAGARERLRALGAANVRLREGDGTLGWPQAAPFDAVLVAAASPRIPPSLLGQLKTGGVMVVPVGGRQEQRLVRVVKRSEGRYQEKELYGVRFVPLVGKEGWEG